MIQAIDDALIPSDTLEEFVLFVAATWDSEIALPGYTVRFH